MPSEEPTTTMADELEKERQKHQRRRLNYNPNKDISAIQEARQEEAKAAQLEAQSKS